jgi:hypothetical protein
MAQGFFGDVVSQEVEAIAHDVVNAQHALAALIEDKWALNRLIDQSRKALSESSEALARAEHILKRSSDAPGAPYSVPV